MSTKSLLLFVNALVVCTTLRACLSVERTLLRAWLRTSLSCLRHVF
jgi:uncharacterized membrane protein YidH (DUF202 family)